MAGNAHMHLLDQWYARAISSSILESECIGEHRIYSVRAHALRKKKLKSSSMGSNSLSSQGTEKLRLTAWRDSLTSLRWFTTAIGWKSPNSLFLWQTGEVENCSTFTKRRVTCEGRRRSTAIQHGTVTQPQTAKNARASPYRPSTRLANQCYLRRLPSEWWGATSALGRTWHLHKNTEYVKRQAHRVSADGNFGTNNTSRLNIRRMAPVGRFN